MILVTQMGVLEKVIQEAIDATTRPRDRLAIVKFLDKMTDELLKKLAISSPTEDTAMQFLT